MQKKAITGLAAVIIIGALVFILLNAPKKPAQQAQTPTPPPAASPSPTAETMESSVKHTVFSEKPGPNLTRHSFEGDIKSISTNGSNTEIFLQNKSQESLPSFILKNDTRLWKKTGSQFSRAQESDIKIGSHVDLQLDKEDTQGFWIFRDVYILK